jgi:rRNA maturation endonuclease Nob1
MKFLFIALLLSMFFLVGCEITKAMKPQYRCSKCGREILMLSGCKTANEYCPQGGKHEWQRISNR